MTVLPKLAVEQNNGFAVHHKKLPKPLRNIYKRIYLARHLSPDDFIICDSWKSVAAIPKYYIGKLVVMAYGQEYLKTGKRAKRVQAALNRATHIIPCSQYTMKMIEAGWSVAHAARTVIAPTYMLPNNAPDFKLRKNKPLKVVSLCRLEERKGLRQSLEALATLGDQVPEWTWTLCGSGPQADELALMIVQLGLEGRVIMPGRVDEDAKAELLAEADLFLMPSYQQGKSLEGYGITYAEAARYGTPAIAGIAGGAPEAVLMARQVGASTRWMLLPCKQQSGTLSQTPTSGMFSVKRRGTTFLKISQAKDAWKLSLRIWVFHKQPSRHMPLADGYENIISTNICFVETV